MSKKETKVEQGQTELETKQESAIAQAPPRKRGLEEDVQSTDLIIPRMMLIQYTPPKNVTIDPKLCPPGSLINNLTALPLTLDETGAVQVIPLIRGVKWIRFNPQEKDKPDFNPEFEPGAKIWESRDPRDPRVIEEGSWRKDPETGKESIPPLATKFIEFLVMVPTEDMPLVIGFAKTSFAAGKQLTSMCTYTSKADIFGDKYRLRVKQDQNDQKQKYFVLSVEKAGDPTPEEYKRAEAYYESFVGKNLKVHGEEAEAEPVSPKQPWQ